MASPKSEAIVIFEKNDDFAISLNLSWVMVATSCTCMHRSLSISKLVLFDIIAL